MSALGVFNSSVDLIVKAAAKNEMCMKVSCRKRIAEKNQTFRSAEHICAILPKTLKYGRLEVLEIRWRNDQWGIAFS
jgi:hypothetical protein